MDLFKKKLKPLLAVLLIISGAIPVSAVGEPDSLQRDGSSEPVIVMKSYSEAEKILTMRKAADNGVLELYVDALTAEIAVRKKSTGKIYFSNPIDAEDEKGMADADKRKVYSQVVLDYYTAGLQYGEIGSFADSILLGQCKITDIKDGISAQMTIGRIEQRQLLPHVIPQKRMDEILDQLKDNSRAVRRLNVFYKLYEKQKLSGGALEKALTNYPSLSTTDLYAIRSVSAKEKKELESYFLQAGYSFEQMEEDYELMQYKEPDTTFPVFELEIRYRLDGENLIASIETDSIQYDRSQYMLYRISLLPYFGAAHNRSEGYLFIPDGSGALVEFNANTSERRQNTMSSRVYGEDLSLTGSVFFGERESYHMPVYGIASGGKGIFSVIEKGNSMADIVTVTGTASQPYNNSYTRFIYSNADSITDKGSGTGITRLDNNAYTGEYAVRYFFLSEEDADYSGMASIYREYLVENGQLSKNASDVLPIRLDLLGSTTVQDKFLIFNINRKIALTTFKQAADIMAELRDSGISGIGIRYLGWANGGLEHSVFSKLKVQKELGGEKGYKELISAAKKADARIYPEADLISFGLNRSFSGFNPSKDNAAQLDSRLTGKTPIHLVTSYQDRRRFLYLISPARISDYLSSFMKSYDKLDSPYLSVGSLGLNLYSDFSKNRKMTSSQSLESFLSAFELLNERYGLMVSKGNAYTYKFAGHIADMPTGNSEFIIENKSVPFMQMVLHSYIDYTPEALNLHGDTRIALLKSIETGSGLAFTLGRQNLLKLKTSRFSEYCSVDYDIWKEYIVESYAQASEALSGLAGEKIIRHMQVGNQVYKTVYGNGDTVYVNYGDAQAQADGQNIGARDYFVVRGERSGIHEREN